MIKQKYWNWPVSWPCPFNISVCLTVANNVRQTHRFLQLYNPTFECLMTWQLILPSTQIQNWRVHVYGLCQKYVNWAQKLKYVYCNFFRQIWFLHWPLVEIYPKFKCVLYFFLEKILLAKTSYLQRRKCPVSTTLLNSLHLLRLHLLFFLIKKTTLTDHVPNNHIYYVF